MNTRCFRIAAPILEAATRVYEPKMPKKRPQTAFEDAIRFAPQPLKERWMAEKLSKVSLKGTHIPQRREFAADVIRHAQITDPLVLERVERTLSFSTKEGGLYVPNAEDVAILEHSLPPEYRRAALASISDGLNSLVSKQNIRKLEEQGLAAEAEELRTRAFQAQQYIDQTYHLLDTYVDMDDLHEIDRLFKKAEAGDAEAQRFVKEVMDYYGVSDPAIAKTALWADAAQRNQELVAKDYSDEFSKRIRQGVYQTGEFNKQPKLKRQALSQEYLEFVYGLRRFDDLSDEMKAFVRKHGLVGEDGFYIHYKRTVQPETLSTQCKYAPLPSRQRRRLPTQEIGGEVAVGQMGTTVAQVLGSGGEEAERIGWMLRSAYSEDELEQVRQYMKQRGYTIPDDATKEEMFKALGSPPIYQSVGLPSEAVDISIQRGLMGTEPPPPPVEPPSIGAEDDFIPEPNLLTVQGAPEEVAQAMGEIVAHRSFDFKSAAERDIAQLLYYATLRSDLTPDSVMDALVGMGSGRSQYMFPLNVALASKLNERSRFFKAIENDGIWIFRLREGAEALIEAEMHRMRRENPALLLYDDDVVKGLIMLSDLGDALLSDAPAVHAHFRQYLYNRLMLFPVHDFEDLLIPLAAHFGSGSIDDLVSKIDIKWANETRRMLAEVVSQQQVMEGIIALLNRQGMVFFGDEVLTADEWDALNRHEKMELVRSIIDDKEKLRQFTQNFLGKEEEMMEYFKGRDLFKMSPKAELKDPEIYFQNPANVAALLRFAKENGLNPSLIITGAKLLYDHLRLWEALWQRLPSYGLEETGKVITPEGLGGNFIKQFYRMVANKLKTAGYEDAADILFAIIENHDVLGWDILQRLLNNEFPAELEELFGRAVDNLGQLLVLQDEFYHKAVNQNFAELFVPVLAALGRQTKEVIDPATGEVKRVLPIFPMVSLQPHAGASQSLGAIVQQTYGMDKNEFYRRIMPLLPDEIQTAYHTLEAVGREHTFDLFVPQIMADIIRGGDFRKIQTLWTFLGDLYKMNLVVFSPRTQLRNIITNLFLISRGVDASLPKVISEYVKSFISAKENSRLYRDLKTIEGAFSGKALFTAEDEALVFGLNRYQRKMSKISAHKIAGFPIRFQSKMEGLGKFTIVRLLLERKYGKDWERLYTQSDLYDALRIVNEWMVDYRFVPPAIDYLRRVVGFFPFITFLYTITSTLLRNPEKLTQEIFRTAKLFWMFDRLTQLSVENEAITQDEEQFLPPYLRNNPLLLLWRNKENNTIQALDLTFWLPLGVFEGLGKSAASAYNTYKEAITGTGGLPPKTPLQALIEAGGTGILHYGNWLFNQAGSVLRPVVEVIANRVLMTGEEIYEPLDPPSVKVEKALLHLTTQIPLIRDTITAINPDVFPRSKASENPEGFLEWVMMNFLSMRKLRLDALVAQKYETFRTRIQQYKSLISRVSRDPHMSDEQKKRFIKQYLQELEALTAEYDNEFFYLIPQYYPEEGKEVYTDPEWYETIEEAIDEYEPITE